MRQEGTLMNPVWPHGGCRPGASHRGPEPVQFQPANRVRAGRQQR